MFVCLLQCRSSGQDMHQLSSFLYVRSTVFRLFGNRVDQNPGKLWKSYNLPQLRPENGSGDLVWWVTRYRKRKLRIGISRLFFLFTRSLSKKNVFLNFNWLENWISPLRVIAFFLKTSISRKQFFFKYKRVRIDFYILINIFLILQMEKIFEWKLKMHGVIICYLYTYYVTKTFSGVRDELRLKRIRNLSNLKISVSPNKAPRRFLLIF